MAAHKNESFLSFFKLFLVKRVLAKAPFFCLSEDLLWD